MNSSQRDSRQLTRADMDRANLISESKMTRAFLSEIEKHLRPNEPAGPYKNLGEFLIDVIVADTIGHPKAESRQGVLKALERRAAPAGAGEQVPADGGHLVQADLAHDLVVKVYHTGFLLSQMDRRETSQSWQTALKVPSFDEVSRVDGSRFGGVRGYWANEADSVTVTKPKYRAVELSLHKLIVATYVTDELMADAAMLETAVEKAFISEAVFKLEDGSINGSGAGKPQGVVGAPGAIVIPKASGQGSQTVVLQNAIDMFARMWGPSRRRACWYVNQEAEEQLMQIAIEVGNAGAPVPWFTFAQEDGEFNRLLGRPIIPAEYAQPLGTQGDVVFADMGEVLFLEKQGGIEQQLSLHVSWLSDQSVFRWVWRCDAQPKWHQPVQPFAGTKTLSPYVVLGAR
jgi:HK97 family phage major capsid protein